MASKTKAEDRNDIFIESLKRKLSILNNSIQSQNNYLVNDKFSIADTAIWRMIGWLISGNLDGIPSNILKNLSLWKG